MVGGDPATKSLSVVREGAATVSGSITQEFLQRPRTRSVVYLWKQGDRTALHQMKPKNGGSAMKVKEVMHRGVDWVSPTTPVTELAKLMRTHDIGCIPI